MPSCAHLHSCLLDELVELVPHWLGTWADDGVCYVDASAGPGSAGARTAQQTTWGSGWFGRHRGVTCASKRACCMVSTQQGRPLACLISMQQVGAAHITCPTKPLGERHTCIDMTPQHSGYPLVQAAPRILLILGRVLWVLNAHHLARLQGTNRQPQVVRACAYILEHVSTCSELHILQ
jgi:hypothetical protein